MNQKEIRFTKRSILEVLNGKLEQSIIARRINAEPDVHLRLKQYHQDGEDVVFTLGKQKFAEYPANFVINYELAADGKP